jgi:DNA-binding transcriptional ArsR family regulator
MFKPVDVCDLVHIDPARVGRLREALVDGDAVLGLADTFRAMGDPTRVRILDALSHGELCVCDLAAVLGLTQSAVSHQLRLLKSLRLVRARRDGRMVFYALDDRHIILLFKQTLKHVLEAAAPGLPMPGQADRGTRAR